MQGIKGLGGVPPSPLGSAQTRLFPAGRPGSVWSIFTSLQLWMQWERGGGGGGQQLLGEQQRVQHLLTVLASPAPSDHQEFVSLQPHRSEILVLPSLYFPCSWGSTLSSSSGSVLPLLLAGVGLWAQPGTGSGIPLIAGIRLSLEALSGVTATVPEVLQAGR